MLAGMGVVFMVGAIEGLPAAQLWGPLVWGGLASLLVGYAVGHAAGRLFLEINGGDGGRVPAPVSAGCDDASKNVHAGVRAAGAPEETARRMEEEHSTQAAAG